MSNTEYLPFTSFDTRLGKAGFLAYMPIQLINQQSTATSSTLLDTGSTVNVLPYPQ
ncbi:MAG: hypothetical protein IGS39_15735 [Calothrix sp. C42_A2020_038]|nr:hypothetical protein [Calothrix sp. C42_A2020_038]